MDKFRYRHLSAGFVGIKSVQETLNSNFLGNLLNTTDLSQKILFPQRVYKTGFFEELCKLEDPAFSLLFNEQIKNIKLSYKNAVKDFQQYDTFKLINILNLMLRLALFDEIINLNIKENINYQKKLEIELIKIIASHQISISNDTPISINNLVHFVNNIVNDDLCPDRLKIISLTRLIVTACRHIQKSEAEEININFYGDQLLNLILKYDHYDTDSIILKSVAYRGAAMINNYGKETQTELLIKAMDYARNIHPQNDLEEIIAKENLYTCLQTWSKWNLYNNKPDEALNNLNEIISLDPLDSTGYTEKGFYLLNQEKFYEAAENFGKAADLGPPCVGMNTFYHAKCLLSMNQTSDAVTLLYKSTELDDLAVSPWLELLEIFQISSDHLNANKIAKHIKDNSELRDQLDENELVMIDKIILHN